VEATNDHPDDDEFHFSRLSLIYQCKDGDSDMIPLRHECNAQNYIDDT
jgi:hypothetical protein